MEKGFATFLKSLRFEHLLANMCSNMQKCKKYGDSKGGLSLSISISISISLYIYIYISFFRSFSQSLSFFYSLSLSLYGSLFFYVLPLSLFCVPLVLRSSFLRDLNCSNTALFGQNVPIVLWLSCFQCSGWYGNPIGHTSFTPSFALFSGGGFLSQETQRISFVSTCISLGLPSLQKCVVKFQVKCHLEFDLKFEISEGKNLVKYGVRIGDRKAREISGRISGQISEQISEKILETSFQVLQLFFPLILCHRSQHGTWEHYTYETWCWQGRSRNMMPNRSMNSAFWFQHVEAQERVSWAPPDYPSPKTGYSPWKLGLSTCQGGHRCGDFFFFPLPQSWVPPLPHWQVFSAAMLEGKRRWLRAISFGTGKRGHCEESLKPLNSLESLGFSFASTFSRISKFSKFSRI